MFVIRLVVFYNSCLCYSDSSTHESWDMLMCGNVWFGSCMKNFYVFGPKWGLKCPYLIPMSVCWGFKTNTRNEMKSLSNINPC